MSIDGQVLVVAFLAISLKLLLWAREADGVEVEDEAASEGRVSPATSRASTFSSGRTRATLE